MTEQAKKSGAVIGGWICLVLATVFMFLTLFSFILYLPLFLAAFVLGIVSIAQKRLANGISILLLSVVIPLLLGLVLGVTRTSDVLAEINKANNLQSPALESGMQRKPTNTVAAIDKQGYITKSIELYDLQAEYINTYTDGRQPAVKFKIKNKGDKTISKVNVLVLFKDKNGAVIGEEDYLPVFLREYDVFGENKPLKPGYIWKPEADKYYLAKSIPTEWKEGAVEARVTDVEFVN